MDAAVAAEFTFVKELVIFISALDLLSESRIRLEFIYHVGNLSLSYDRGKMFFPYDLCKVCNSMYLAVRFNLLCL